MEHLIMPADKGAQPTDRVVLATSPTATGTFPRMATAIALMLELRIVDDHPSRRTNQLADHPTRSNPANARHIPAAQRNAGVIGTAATTCSSWRSMFTSAPSSDHG